MNINYPLIAISFTVPIIGLLFQIKNGKKISPKLAIAEWLASGIMACLVQFIGLEFEVVKTHEIAITIIIALSAEKTFTFVNKNTALIFRAFIDKNFNSKKNDN